jgi:hypothetical protein
MFSSPIDTSRSPIVAEAAVDCIHWEALWSSCILTHLHSLNGPVGLLFASRLGGQRFTSWGCTHTSGTGILLLAMSCYIGDPRRHPWSPAMIGPLTLATGCFSHPSCPSSILIAGHRLVRRTTRILSGPDPLLGGALWAPAFSHHYTVSLVQWVNRLLPA